MWRLLGDRAKKVSHNYQIVDYSFIVPECAYYFISLGLN